MYAHAYEFRFSFSKTKQNNSGADLDSPTYDRLTPAGDAQAIATAKRLATSARIEYVLSAAENRTQATAAEIARYQGLPGFAVDFNGNLTSTFYDHEPQGARASRGLKAVACFLYATRRVLYNKINSAQKEISNRD